MNWWSQGARTLDVTGSDVDGWRVYDLELDANVAGPYPTQWEAAAALLLVYHDR